MKKTGGNPFAVQQLLMTLVRKNLLTYNIGLTRWLWDEDAIRVSAVAENIAEIMKVRLGENPVAYRILPIAACLGSTFSVTTLETIKDRRHDCGRFVAPESASVSKSSSLEMSMSSDFIQGSFGTSDLHEDLRVCVVEGFIEQSGEGKFTFVHDKVQEAALGLIPDRRHVKFLLGEIIWLSSDVQQLEECLFEVIGLLKEKLEYITNGRNTKRNQELAALFYKAGRKAQGVAAFRAAGDYYKMAIDLISIDTWEDREDFCIDLYSAAAESEYNDGRFEQMQVYTSRLLSVDCEMRKKLRICYVHLQSYAATEVIHDQAVDFGIQTLAGLGCNLPTSAIGVKLKTISGLISFKLSASKVTPEFLDRLPVTADPVHNGIMKILDALLLPCYTRKPELIPLLAIEMNRLTMKHGITPYAAYSFYLQGWIFTHLFGNLEAGKKFAEHAFALFKKYGFKEIEPKTIFIIYSSLWHWTNPLSNDVHVFYELYEKGMKVGDCGTGLMSICYYLEAAMYTGRNLDSIDNDLVNYMNHTMDFKQRKIFSFMEILLQCVRNLRGKSGNTTILTGTVMDEAKKVEHYKKMKNVVMLAHVRKRKLFLCTLFGEFELGVDLAMTEADNMIKAQIGQSSVPVVAFNASLCCFAVARNSKNKKQQRAEHAARKYRRMIKKWSQYNPNCVVFSYILDAEKAALLGKYDDAVANYEQAILRAGRSGLISEQALANERLGSLYLDQKNFSDARYSFDKAVELYTEWGSLPKARKLKKYMDEKCNV